VKLSLECPWPKGPALVINAAQKPIEIGWWEDNAWRTFQFAQGEVLEQLFQLTQSVLTQAERTLEDVQSFIYNTGPGSLLGLRLAAMAIATWRTLPQCQKATLLRFSGLQLSALALSQKIEYNEAFLLSDFRRGAFNKIQIKDQQLSTLSTISSDDLALLDAPLFFQPGVRSFQPPPPNATVINSQLHNLPSILKHSPDASLLQLVDQPFVYTPEIPSFVKWSAQRHR